MVYTKIILILTPASFPFTTLGDWKILCLVGVDTGAGISVFFTFWRKKNLIKIILNDTKLLNLMIKNLDVNIKFCIYNVLEKYMYSLSSLVYEKRWELSTIVEFADLILWVGGLLFCGPMLRALES